MNQKVKTWNGNIHRFTFSIQKINGIDQGKCHLEVIKNDNVIDEENYGYYVFDNDLFFIGDSSDLSYSINNDYTQITLTGDNVAIILNKK